MDQRDFEALKADLEAIVDQSSVSDVLRALSEVCADKAVHLETNWQDIPASKLWIRRAGICDAAHGRVEKAVKPPRTPKTSPSASRDVGV